MERRPDPRWVAGSRPRRLTGVGLVVVCLWLLTIDLTMVPIAVATSTAITGLMHAASPAFPGAWIGSIAGAALAVRLGWWWFRALRYFARTSRSTPCIVITTG